MKMGLGIAGMSFFTVIWALLNLLVHVFFALGVYKFAKAGEVDGKQTWLVTPPIWALTTLILGPFIAGVYWLIHHSSLGRFNNLDAK